MALKIVTTLDYSNPFLLLYSKLVEKNIRFVNRLKILCSYACIFYQVFQ